MMKHTLCIIICILVAFLVPQTSQACSAFFLDGGGQRLMGKNFDWYTSDGFVVVNKRHVKKAAMIAPTADQTAARWTSKYGSITFNHQGCDLATGGINEAGLAITVLQLLKETEYPAAHSRPAIPQLQWRQYQLDNFRTVKEVIASDSQIRIFTPISPYPTHYLVCDKSGDCAVIEFIGGKMIYHTNETMPAKALTTKMYAESVSFWKQGKLPYPDPARAIDRFVRAADMVRDYDPKTSKSALDYAFEILRKNELFRAVSTQWSIVYDLKDFRVYFRTKTNQQIRYIDGKALDFSCTTPVKLLEIKSNLKGNVTNSFQDYTRLLHRNWVTNINSGRYKFPKDIVDAISQYPESIVCTQ